MQVRIPWWLNPWLEASRVKRRHELHKARCGELREAQEATIRRLAAEAVDLRRQLDRTRALPDGMLSTEVPEFIFIGIPRPDGSKRLWASKDLTGTAFSMTADDLSGPKWKIGAVMAHSLTVDKPDYSSCIQRVLEIWANWLSNAKGLPGGNGRPWDSPDADVAGDLRAAHRAALRDPGPFREIEAPDKEK